MKFNDYVEIFLLPISTSLFVSVSIFSFLQYFRYYLTKNYYEFSNILSCFLNCFSFCCFKNQKYNNSKKKEIEIPQFFHSIFRIFISNFCVLIFGILLILIITLIEIISVLFISASIFNIINYSIFLFFLFILGLCNLIFGIFDIFISRKKIFKLKRLKIDFNWYFFFDDPLFFRLDNIFLYFTIFFGIMICIILIIDQIESDNLSSKTYFIFMIINFTLYLIFFIIISVFVHLFNGGFVALHILLSKFFIPISMKGKTIIKNDKNNDFIHEFLKNDDSYNLFYEYAKREFSVENVLKIF